MKKIIQNNIKLTRVAVAATLALSAPLTLPPAFAGAGWGDSVDLTGAPVKVPTYYANSPSGMQKLAVLLPERGPSSTGQARAASLSAKPSGTIGRLGTHTMR